MKIEKDFTKVKEKLAKQKFLYQYRPCSISETTIYDLENIKNDVLFARSPIHMNDPFDSTISLDETNMVNEVIDSYLDSTELPMFAKKMFKIIIKSRFLKTFDIFLSDLFEIKKYVKVICLSNHWTINNNLFSIYEKYSTLIYGRLPKHIKSKYKTDDIKGLLRLIDILGDKELTEENILKIKGFNETLDDAENKLVLFRNNEFKKAVEQFQKRITVSCLSGSGWNNHLMWSHYTNSYQGICVEYDFSKMNEFIGIIDKVYYSKQRPKIRFRDLIPGGIKCVKSEDGKVNCIFDKNEKVDIDVIIPFLFTKQELWKYEEEWRIVNSEDKDDVFRFISVPFINSITYGQKINLICKCMLFEICKDKSIDLYELIPSTKDYSLDRKKVNLADNIFSQEEFEKYILYLLSDIGSLFPIIGKQSELIIDKMESKEIDSLSIIELFKNYLKLMSEIFFYKSSIITLFKNYNVAIKENEIQNLKLSSKQIELFIDNLLKTSIEVDKAINTFVLSGAITRKDVVVLRKQFSDIRNINNKISSLNWPF